MAKSQRISKAFGRDAYTEFKPNYQLESISMNFCDENYRSILEKINKLNVLEAFYKRTCCMRPRANGALTLAYGNFFLITLKCIRKICEAVNSQDR